MSEADAAMFRLRATRARPPGRASSTERRETYGAALNQFDELIASSAVVGAASRPLTLFYALSQAGRAIAAAHAGEEWRLRGHGLRCPGTASTLLTVEVLRASKSWGGAVDSFAGVAAATDSATFQKRTSIGALWASLPEVANLLPRDMSAEWLRPLLLVPEEHEHPHLVNRDYVKAAVVGSGIHAPRLEGHIRDHYPTADSVRLLTFQGRTTPVVQHTDFGPGIMVIFPAVGPSYMEHVATLDQVGTRGIRLGPRHLRPAVDGAPLSPLMSWWALLFGLSMVARYEPAAWTAALALDSSPLAAPLEECLRLAVERIPQLVLEALGDY